MAEGQAVMETIKILGAGPAGLAAAIHLAQHGQRVTVFDKGMEVGSRFHNDFQGLENWTREEDVVDTLHRLGIQINFFCQPFRGGGFYNPSLKRLEVRSPKPIFYLVKRGSGSDTLDTGLKRQAQAIGVEIRFGERRRPEEMNVVASGPRKAKAVATGILFETDLADTASVILNDDLSPKGYSYLLVANGQATLATVLWRRFNEAKPCLEKTIATFQRMQPFQVRHPRPFGGFGDCYLPSSAIRAGRLYAGEAGGFQDYLFGFGIRCALVSGHLAAESLLTGTNYDTLWRDELGAYLKASFGNRLLLEVFGKLGYNWLVRRVGKSHNPRGYMKGLYDWTLSRRIVYPLSRGLQHPSNPCPIPL